MKKLIFLSIVFCAVAASSLVVYTQNNMPKGHGVLSSTIECLTQDEGSGECKWKIIDCPGWFTGDYEACLTSGDGHQCSCGQITRDC